MPAAALLARVDRARSQGDPVPDMSRTRTHDRVSDGDDQPLVGSLVLHLLAAELSGAEVGQKLVIAAGTVKTHTASIYSKLDVDSRTRAVAHARELGLLDP